MKSFLIAIFFSLFVVACYNEPAPPEYDENFTMKPNYKEPDTVSKTVSLLNYVDRKGLRQGKWILHGRDGNDSTFPDTAIWREGIYADSKEEGAWLEYFPNGKIKRKISFKRGVELK